MHSKKRIHPSTITIVLLLIGIVATIPEMIAKFRPLFILESTHLYNISNIAVNTLVILGLLIGTVLSFAKHEADEIRFGYTANERILYYNTIKVLNFKINLLEMLFVNYLLIPITIGCFIFSYHNAVVTVLFISLLITIIEFILSIGIITNNTDSIDDNCKEAIQNEITANSYVTLKKMLLSFYDKINDQFIFGDEYKFFVKIMGEIKEDADFPGYYPETQRLISRLIYDKRLNVNRTSKLVHDLIFGVTLKSKGGIIIYLDDAVIWASNHTDWKTTSLFQMLEICYYKFKGDTPHSIYEMEKLMENFYKLLIGLENNKLLNPFDYQVNISEMEKLSFKYATLKDVVIWPPMLDTDYYIEFDEETISTHQMPMFLIINNYIKTRNNRIIGILRMLNKKEHILISSPNAAEREIRLDFNNAKLKYLLIIKLSYFFFALSSEEETSAEQVEFIKKIIYDNQHGFSFAYLMQKIRLSKKVSIRKDTIYDYFFPISTGMENMGHVIYLVCLSILKGFCINYQMFINIEIGYAVKMFNGEGLLKIKYCAYMNNISQFFGIAYSEKRSKVVFAQIMKEAKKYDLDYIIREENYVKESKKNKDFFDNKLIR